MSQLSTKDRHGLIIGGVVVVAFIALFAVYVVLSNKEPLDDRFCPSSIARKTVFLVDRSDNAPTQTVAEIRKRIIRTIDQQVQQGELVSIFYITDTVQEDLQPVFSSCKPKSRGNALYEGTRTIEKNFATKFRRPLDAALAKQPSGADTSPIAEALTDFSTSDYLDGRYNRLVVFSDLMQNSDALSLYSCIDSQSAISSYRRNRTGAVERPELKNVDVSLNIIPRQGLGSQVVTCRNQFWAWYFGDNEGEHAKLTSKYLPGGVSVQ